jgi:hypothetical protein
MMNDLNDDNLRRRRHNDVATIRFLLEEALIFSSESTIQRRRQSSHFTFEERDIRRDSFVGIFPLLRRFLFLWVFGLLLIVLSACEYFVFYKLVMPGLHTSQILSFDYTGLDYQTKKKIATKYVDNTCERNTANTTNITRMVSSSSSNAPLRVSEQEDENYRQLMELAPFAVVDLFATHQSWQHKIPDIVPRLKTRKHILTEGTPHYIEIL